ncbi:hypothetical protein MPSEU_000045000 [Mayamaea pseudoterrestris]|nr:hypothetical protein MPSEU_000045000 [Mayamaea pseudoterrestris]
MRAVYRNKWLLLWLLSIIVHGLVAVNEESQGGAEAGANDVDFQLDDDNDESPIELHEYKYDADALHDQWSRDLVWDNALDQEIRRKHDEFAAADHARRQLESGQADDATIQQVKQQKQFIQSLYQGNPNDLVSCFIGYKTLKGRQQIIRAAFDEMTHEKHDFGEVNSIAVTLPKYKLVALIENYAKHIDFVEEDQQVAPNQLVNQVTPYGIKLAQGGNRLPNSNLPNNCSKKRSFKIGIIDAGFDVGHPDLSCSTPDATNCLGSTFGLSSDEKWYNPTRDHGTHVAGTIGALGNNNIGVVGMIPDSNVCYIIARVFGDDGGASFSSILAAVKWSIANGANVINMSLSGDTYDTTAARVFADAYDKDNRILVAAAGNDGESICRYPACYTSVLSIAAVDSSSKVASFSNFNNLVDLAAPGVGVLSTVPGATTATITTPTGDRFSSVFMANSPRLPQSGVTGKIKSCGTGLTKCKRSTGGICIIKRGINTFQEKVINCQHGGGNAAIIFNNVTGSFSGWIPDDGQVTIPVLSADLATGRALQRKFAQAEVHIVSDKGGYAELSGTSMSAPHVTGAVAALWRSCRNCKNKDIVACLASTAKDLGAPGKDIYYGFGLVQTEDAYECLKSVAHCC